MSSAFFRLHPILRHAIAHDLGWRALRPVQELAIPPILDGHNTLILAPTAGGKTEASLFPVLSQILSASASPVAALYLSPIRALLNDQEDRIRGYARMVGLDACKWHGDVDAAARDRFRRDPAHVLMITPESLEVTLISRKTDARALFSGLTALVVDEIHAFAGDDRGAHLMSLVERLVRFCGRDLQRIGLSATVGEPARIGDWLRGSGERPSTLVEAPGGPVREEVRIHLATELGETAALVARLARGRKSLVFVSGRAQAEKVTRALTGSGVEVFVHHSAVSRAERERAEARLREGAGTAIICTSTMELGIDVGDLERVIQLAPPATVASYRQRLGRTGRRPGARANSTFVCASAEGLLQALAVVRLAARGWVEPLRPVRRAWHVLAHQVMALILQEGGISRHRVLPWIGAAAPFRGLGEAEVGELIQTMIEREILYEADGVLSLGRRGENLYGRRNFFELYAVFSTPPVLRVLHGRDEVGTLQASFLQRHDTAGRSLCFQLGGRAWEVRRVEWPRGIVRVGPAAGGRVPSWLGTPAIVSFTVCQEMRRVLVEEDAGDQDWLAPVACTELRELRAAYQELFASGPAPLEHDGQQCRWHTFAGGGINHLLAAGLGEVSGARWVAGNLSLRAPGVAKSAAAEAVRTLPELDWDAVALRSVSSVNRRRLSKFQPCLPEAVEKRFLVEALLDVPATRGWLEKTLGRPAGGNA